MTPSAGTSEGRAVDEETIRKVMADYDNTWNQHAINAHAQLFTEDADFVDVVGAYLKGRSEIERQHTEMHAGQYKDSHMTASSVAVRFLSPDIAVVHRAAEAVYNRGNVKRKDVHDGGDDEARQPLADCRRAEYPKERHGSQGTVAGYRTARWRRLPTQQRPA